MLPEGDIEPPLPALAVMAYDLRLKLALTLRLEFMMTVHLVDVPEHESDQPVKLELEPDVAVRVTDALGLKVVPVGLLVTVPLPEPFFTIVSVYVCAPA